MSRIGVVCAVLLAAASSGAAPPRGAYETTLACGFQVRARGQSYGLFGNAAQVSYHCVPVEVPKVVGLPPLPAGVKAVATGPAVLVEPD